MSITQLSDGTMMARDDDRQDGHATEEKIAVIQAHLDDGEVLTQLAEEAAELAQAALKLRRAITGKNPTPMSKAEALDSLVEEIADVNACLACLTFKRESIDLMIRREMKLTRWAERLKEAKTNANRG